MTGGEARAGVTDERSIEIRNTTVPRIGFGTWLLYGAAATEAVRDALEIGYRHIDTARLYDNEIFVGHAIASSGVPRSELFLTTKVYLRVLLSGSTHTFSPDSFKWATEDSLGRLNTDYLDLLLLHWPDPDAPFEPALEAMAELKERGWIRNLGVSNFPAGMLRRACDVAPVFCNQIEYHPFLSQERILSAARELDVLITAFRPMAEGRVIGDETLRKIGGAHGKTPAQVALRWIIDQPGVVTIPTATTHEWRTQNFDVFDFALTPEERAEIDSLPKDYRITDAFWLDWDA